MESRAVLEGEDLVGTTTLASPAASQSQPGKRTLCAFLSPLA